MPTFFRRRYMRRIEAVGTTERVVGVLILLLLAGIVATFIIQTATNTDYLFEVDETAYQSEPDQRMAAVGAPEQGGNPFPDAGVEGWRAPTRVSRYTPETLYEKINGRADTYLQFHMVGLTFGTYSHGTNTDRLIDVYWYDMGEPVNALGMYQAEASPDTTPIAIGRDGYQVGGAVFFRKGSSYVQVLPTMLGEDDAGVALNIAKMLAEAIEDIVGEWWALNVLPKSKRVKDSFRYIAQDAFSMGFLSDVYAAEYDVDGEPITLFVHRAGAAASAKVLFDRYVEFFNEYGRVIWNDPDASRLIVAGDVAAMIDVVFVKDRYVGGVTGAENAEVAKTAAVAFYEELTPP